MHILTIGKTGSRDLEKEKKKVSGSGSQQKAIHQLNQIILYQKTEVN